MLNHADVGAFTLGTGATTAGAAYLDVGTDGPDWNFFKVAALATGAFPVGLKRNCQRVARPGQGFSSIGLAMVSTSYARTTLPSSCGMTPSASFARFSGRREPFALYDPGGCAWRPRVRTLRERRYWRHRPAGRRRAACSQGGARGVSSFLRPTAPRHIGSTGARRAC
jgi:hypothetical protein